MNENVFLPPRERDIKDFAYYGEFFVNLGFDDGYNSIFLNALYDYLKSINVPEIEIYHGDIQGTKDIFKDKLDIVIRARQSTPSIKKELIHITTKLQADFFLSPIFQNTSFSSGKKEFPIELDISEDQGGDIYTRLSLQKEQAKVYDVMQQITSLEYKINALSFQSEDKIIGNLVSQWKTMVETLKSQLPQLIQEFQNLVALKYLESSSRFGEKVEGKILSPFQAEVILGFKEENKKENSGRILRLISKFEEIIRQMGEKANIIEGGENQTGITQKLGKQKPSKGVLHNIKKTKDNFLISASLLLTNKQICHDGEKICGFKLDGVDIIRDIKKITENDKGIVISFLVQVDEKKQMYFYLEQGKYKSLTLQGESQFSFIDFTFVEKITTKPLSGLVKTEKGMIYFYTIDNTYYYLKIGNIILFKDISIQSKSDNGKPQCGTITRIGNTKQYFYLEDGKYKIFEVEGEDTFQSIVVKKSENNKPVSGIFETKNGKKIFYTHQDKLQFLVIDKNDIFDMSLRDFKFHTENCLSGRINYGGQDIVHFYKQGDEFKIFTFGGEKFIEHLDTTKTGDSGIPDRGILYFKDQYKKIFFIKKKEGDFCLEINGVQEFQNISYIEFSDSGEILKGRVDNMRQTHMSFFFIKKGRFFFRTRDCGTFISLKWIPCKVEIVPYTHKK